VLLGAERAVGLCSARPRMVVAYHHLLAPAYQQQRLTHLPRPNNCTHIQQRIRLSASQLDRRYSSRIWGSKTSTRTGQIWIYNLPSKPMRRKTGFRYPTRGGR